MHTAALLLPLCIAILPSIVSSLSSRGLASIKRGLGVNRMLRVMYIGDFLCPNSPDFELVEALDNIGIVEEVLTLQIDELQFDFVVAQIHNFRPHVLMYSASTCNFLVNHDDSNAIISHCALMGTRTMAIVLRCEEGGEFKSKMTFGFWKANYVLVDDWSASITSLWLAAGVRLMWLGHAIAARLCSDADVEVANANEERRLHVVIVAAGSYAARVSSTPSATTKDFLLATYGDLLLQVDHRTLRDHAMSRILATSVVIIPTFDDGLAPPISETDCSSKVSRISIAMEAIAAGALAVLEGGEDGDVKACVASESSSDGGGVAELLNGTHLLIYPRGDSKALAQILSDHIGGRLVGIRSAGRAAVCSEHTWEARLGGLLHDAFLGGAPCLAYEPGARCRSGAGDVYRGGLRRGQKPGQIYFEGIFQKSDNEDYPKVGGMSGKKFSDFQPHFDAKTDGVRGWTSWPQVGEKFDVSLMFSHADLRGVQARLLADVPLTGEENGDGESNEAMARTSASGSREDVLLQTSLWLPPAECLNEDRPLFRAILPEVLHTHRHSASGMALVAIERATVIADAALCASGAIVKAFRICPGCQASTAGCTLSDDDPRIVFPTGPRALLLVRNHGWFFGHFVQDLLPQLAFAAHTLGNEDNTWSVILESDSHPNILALVRAVLEPGILTPEGSNVRGSGSGFSKRLVFADSQCLRGKALECGWFIRVPELLLSETYPDLTSRDNPVPYGAALASLRIRAHVARQIALLRRPGIYGLESEKGPGNLQCTSPKAAQLSSFGEGQVCYSNCVSDTEDDIEEADLQEESEAISWEDNLVDDSTNRARWATCFRCKVTDGTSMHPDSDSTGLGNSGCYSFSAPDSGGCWAGTWPASFVLLGRGDNSGCRSRDRCALNQHQVAEALAWASRVLRDLIPRQHKHTSGTGGSVHEEDWPADLNEGLDEAGWRARHEAGRRARHWGLGQLRPGVEIVNFELRTHTLLEAAAAIGQAWLLFSIQGSQSFNAVFARRGVAFIEVVPSLDHYPTSNHAFLRALGLRVWVLPARGVARTVAASLVPLVVEIPAVLRAAFQAFDVPVAAASSLIMRRPILRGPIQSAHLMNDGTVHGSVLCQFEVVWIALHMDLIDHAMCQIGLASQSDSVDPLDPAGSVESCITVSLRINGSDHVSSPLGSRPACEVHGRFVVELPAMQHPLSLVVRAAPGTTLKGSKSEAWPAQQHRDFGWAGVESEEFKLRVDPCS